ncbi:hypothetical protein SAMN03159496_00089 [Rhizobium sp. NFR07]|uniref:hypothetical protein n=1 Tax=Rhizobium sp. NFR07 TaxID=1566262 RepID=UPI0008F1A3DA|nr:hypothetical protein [Rhizobium sp. NFR07]SFA73997.1 hypothetical protein SAMN03159496_00089 [Rhizobium sp. NFR07]
MPLYQSGVSDVGVESAVPALAWGPVIGGAVAASATTLILLLFGSGVGLTIVSPWTNDSASAATVGITAGIWLVVVQWLSSALGGYLTGRLRTKWAGVHTDEVFFRDTAHGFLSWALATVVVAGLAGSAFTSLVGSGVQAAGSAASTATVAGAAASSGDAAGPDIATSYFTDALLRPQDLRSRADTDNAAATAEVSRILMNGAIQGGVPDEDKAYLAAIVASRSGLTPEEARARVDGVLQQIDEAKKTAQQTADEARQAAATTAMLGALSLLVGAFIACAAAALGGRQRDDEETRLAVPR